MPELKAGQKAPAFITQDQNGKTISLKDFKNKHIVLYFYPKDDTPGCTSEACSFRDQWSLFEKNGVAILGVSPDSVDSHQKFIQKYQLPFTLLADEDRSICKAYNVWVEKSMYGKKYMGVERSTFLINPEGVIVKIFPKVKPTEHVAEVLETLKVMQPNVK